MSLSKRQIRQLENIISSAQSILATAGSETGKGPKAKSSGGGKRIRRSGKELTAFRKALKAERKKGVPVADIARKHNVSPAYIYQL